MMDWSILAQIKWRPTIGDPTMMGWVTVAAYFFCGLVTLKLCLASREIFPQQVASRQRQFWFCLGLMMLFLGVNKQLDLQSLLTAIGRYFAHRDGWYDHRRVVQVGVILGILGSLSLAMFSFVMYFKPIIRTNWLAIVGLGLLLLFIGVRATSFHHMDALINTRLLNVRVNWILELGGIATITLPALLFLGSRRKT